MMRSSLLLLALAPLGGMAARVSQHDMLASNAGVNSTGPSYTADMLRLKVNGYQAMFCGLSSDDCATLDGYPGGHVHNELTWEEVVKQMQPVPERQGKGEIYRGNELGYLILNPNLWDHDFKTIGLGLTVPQHQWVRPILDELLGSASEGKFWSSDMIAASLKDHFDNLGTMHSVATVADWATKLLHKIHLNMTLTDDEAKAFVAFQTNVVPKVPDWPALVQAAFGWPAIQEERDTWLEKYMEAIKADTRGIFPTEVSQYSGDRLRLLASSLLDSLLFAGGLSVSGGISSGLAVLAADASPWKERGPMTTEIAEQFGYEVLRKMPAVVGFPFWTPDRKERTVLNIAMSLRDKRAWGDDFLEFKIRPMETYKKLIRVAWAEPSNGPEAWAVANPGRTGNLNPMSRGCPAQAMSVTMITGFFKYWSTVQDSWAIAAAPAKGTTFNDVTPFYKGGGFTLAKIVKEGEAKLVSGSDFWGHSDDGTSFVRLVGGDATRPGQLHIFKNKDASHGDVDLGDVIVLAKGTATKHKEGKKDYKLEGGWECVKIYGSSTVRMCVNGKENRDAWYENINNVIHR